MTLDELEKVKELEDRIEELEKRVVQVNRSQIGTSKLVLFCLQQLTASAKIWDLKAYQIAEKIEQLAIALRPVMHDFHLKKELEEALSGT